MNATVVVVAWNGEQYLGACLDSVLRQEPRPALLVIDNDSRDATVAVAKAYADAGHRLVILRNQTNLGFTRAANIALTEILPRAETNDLVVLLNQDATLMPGWLAAVGETFAGDEKAGIVGPKLLYPDGVTLQHTGGYLERPRLTARHSGQHQRDERLDVATVEAEFVTGAAMALRVACLRQVGLFNEVFSPGYYEDVELCARARRAGWRVRYCPRAVALHVESASFGRGIDTLVLAQRNRLIYAIPELTDDRGRQAFEAAERASFAVEPYVEILRAQALAYLSVLLRLSELARARLERSQISRAVLLGLKDLWARLRGDCLLELRRRRRALGPTGDFPAS